METYTVNAEPVLLWTNGDYILVEWIQIMAEDGQAHQWIFDGSMSRYTLTELLVAEDDPEIIERVHVIYPYHRLFRPTASTLLWDTTFDEFMEGIPEVTVAEKKVWQEYLRGACVSDTCFANGSTNEWIEDVEDAEEAIE